MFKIRNETATTTVLLLALLILDDDDDDVSVLYTKKYKDNQQRQYWNQRPDLTRPDSTRDISNTS